MIGKNPDWMILEIEGTRFFIEPMSEMATIKALFNQFPADIPVIVRDYDTNEIIDENPLNVLYYERTNQPTNVSQRQQND